MPDPIVSLNAALEGRYILEREVGQGGMATVYLARDVRHNRSVALKVLRPELATALGPERFLREIEIAANLMHPHILPLYDSGEAGSFLYYVMPFVNGETLRERVDREGELPIAEVVRILREIVDALAFAHAQGVVHRDVKPDNVMLSGRHAMVTDFGVAKAVSEATEDAGLTTVGVALGTPTYMAPEQATADPHIDHRADLYSVGALAYHLLSGRPPFTGSTPQAVLAAHLTGEVEPVSKHRDQVPPALEQLVMRCLAKKQADRWQSADEMLPQLDALAMSSGGMTPAVTRPVTARAPSLRKGLVVGVVGLGMVLVGWLGTGLLRDEPPTVTVLSNRQITRAAGLEIDPAISPDGREVAYVAGPLGRTKVFLQDTEGLNPLALGAEIDGSHRGTRWTPDGRRIVFTVEQAGGARTVSMSRTGGQVEHLTTGSTSYLALSPDNQWMAEASGESITIRSMAGDSTVVIREGVGIQAHSPSWSPDGSLVAYVVNNPEWTETSDLGNAAPSQVRVLSVEDHDVVEVASGGMNLSPAWLPDSGHLLFLSDRDGSRDLYLQRVGPDGAPLGRSVRVTTGAGAQALSVSADGRRVAYSAFTFARNLFKLPIPEEGATSMSEATALTRGNQVTEGSAVSPDGRWVAFSADLEGRFHLYRVPTSGGEPEQLTSDVGGDFQASWSPDGNELAFHSLRAGDREIFTLDLTTRGLLRITSDVRHDWNPDWSPLGDVVLFTTLGDDGFILQTVTRDSSSRTWSEAVALGVFGNPAVWSPDGALIAATDGSIVEVVDADGGNRRTLSTVRDLGQTDLRSVEWSTDGSRLYVMADRDGQASIWAVPVDGGAPEPVVEADDAELAVVWPYFSQDGENFYLNMAQFESDIWVMEIDWR